MHRGYDLSHNSDALVASFRRKLELQVLDVAVGPECRTPKCADSDAPEGPRGGVDASDSSRDEPRANQRSRQASLGDETQVRLSCTPS